ncbi:MAG: dUTP diphosphatase [Bacteroidetes bacterium]|jgi:dUTP pyrophosphatase|nr:dUTP diphosphatase [Bacteroidota bacterium]MDA0938159.1 dUTP diphosphatase [Bacteroidota bacterium]MDA1344501.1 dUTP diphosphatase [Bacteroidota bacterium]
MVRLPVINNSRFDLPNYESTAAAGLDLRANIDDPIVLGPLKRRVIPTGLSIALPEGYEAQIRPRSGLSAKFGITVLNAPGTIDADYRGDIGVILINLSEEEYTLQPGERIAQMVVAPFTQIQWEPVETLSETTRGEKGFGSTGKN